MTRADPVPARWRDLAADVNFQPHADVQPTPESKIMSGLRWEVRGTLDRADRISKSRAIGSGAVMKRILLACGAVAAMVASAPAMAHVDLGVSIGIPIGIPAVVAPAPVYYPPAPQYVAPAPVYVAPQPVYAVPVYPAPVYAPAPVVYPSIWLGGVFGDGWRGHHRGHWR